MLFILIALQMAFIWASETPCSEFEVIIRSHEVQAYTRKDGTTVSNSHKKEHCREIFIGTKNWVDSFSNEPLKDWPYPEKFKPWSKIEKELVLKIISNWPDIFQAWKGASIHRAVQSNFKNNPASSLPSSNAIIIYDSFFKEKNRGAIVAHELAHIYILQLNADKLKKILMDTGWVFEGPKPRWTGKILLSYKIHL